MCRVSPIKTFPRVEVNNSVELTGLLWAEQEEGGAGGVWETRLDRLPGGEMLLTRVDTEIQNQVPPMIISMWASKCLVQDRV